MGAEDAAPENEVVSKPMKAEWLQGVWAAIPVPWDSRDRVDAGAVRELMRRYREAGLDGVYTTGTDGEMHVLEMDDFRALVDAFADGAMETGLPVQVGCTWSHTAGVIERARYAQERGVPRAQIALPSWVPLSDDEMLRFFAALQDALTDVDLIHYNIARAGRFLSGKDYRAILGIAPNLRGSKHTGGDVASLIEITQATPELAHFVVDTQIVPGALFGARGFYSFVANLNPAFTGRLWKLCKEGQWEEAAQLRIDADRFFRAWRAISPEITASPALAKIATRAGIFPEMPLEVRAPYRSGDQAHVDRLRQLLEEEFPQLTYQPGATRREDQI
jgi:dihydrodipicolinate synthase/N-acetylneuraminate lyase